MEIIAIFAIVELIILGIYSYKKKRGGLSGLLSNMSSTEGSDGIAT